MDRLIIAWKRRRRSSIRLNEFRVNRPFPNLEGKVVIVVDDGLASGFSMLITVKTLRDKAGEIVVAVTTA